MLSNDQRFLLVKTFRHSGEGLPTCPRCVMDALAYSDHRREELLRNIVAHAARSAEVHPDEPHAYSDFCRTEASRG